MSELNNHDNGNNTATGSSALVGVEPVDDAPGAPAPNLASTATATPPAYNDHDDNDDDKEEEEEKEGQLQPVLSNSNSNNGDFNEEDLLPRDTQQQAEVALVDDSAAATVGYDVDVDIDVDAAAAVAAAEADDQNKVDPDHEEQSVQSNNNNDDDTVEDLPVVAVASSDSRDREAEGLLFFDTAFSTVGHDAAPADAAPAATEGQREKQKGEEEEPANKKKGRSFHSMYKHHAQEFQLQLIAQAAQEEEEDNNKKEEEEEDYDDEEGGYPPELAAVLSEDSPRVLAAASTETDTSDTSSYVADLPQTARLLFPSSSGDGTDNKQGNKKVVEGGKEDFEEDDTMPDQRPSTALTEPPSMFFHGDDSERYHHDGPAALAKNFHTRIIHRLQKTLVGLLQTISGVAVRFPRLTLIGLSLLSLGLIVGGYMTDFQIETQTHELWPPRSSISLEHSYWVWYVSWFNMQPLTLDVLIHKQGVSENVLSQEGVERVFEVEEVFTGIGQYKQGCAYAETYKRFSWIAQCYIDSVADFWNESLAEYESTVHSDQDAIDIMSQTVYPNGVLVDVDTILGNTQRDNDTGILTSAESYLIRFGIPWSNVTLPFEAQALDRMLLLKREWEARGDEFTLEVRSHSSYSGEFLRSIEEDLWLLPLAFGIVALFTVFFAFGKCDRVKSRGLLGIGAVITIVASMMASFGILFCMGIPWTTQTMMVPFVMFGIGLDDAFIIYGSYNRRAHITDIKERINSTMEDVGVSIFLTSLTSMLAFVLGSFSDIPAVSWLCQYSFPCIAVDFFYQITFFVALMVLDEERIQQGRMDYCTCITVRKPPPAVQQDLDRRDANESEMDAEDMFVPNVAPLEEEPIHFADRLMTWWAGQLLKGQVQLMALIAFVALMGASIYCATQLHQEFDFVDLVPQDSYLKTYYSALDTYTTKDGVFAHAIFRDVDQSNPEVQAQMFDYIDDLVQHGNVDEPVYFWLRDFQSYSAQQSSNSTFQNMTFHKQVQEFLEVDIYFELYDGALGITNDGYVLQSRVTIHINVDIQDSKAATEMLSKLREISASQPINQDAHDLRFFTYTAEYHLYEFYNTVIEELIFTSVMSVVAVSVVSILFIPHWTAVLFVFPFICFLYVNMLGFLYLSGVQINAISYVTLVMSIGLMIDYIMHILMRYYDSQGSRQQRVQETMSSMGSSIFLGAASTFLGVMCLSLSTSDVLQDIFVAVVGLITFGVLNGLIFLPVALANLGPEEVLKHSDEVVDLTFSEPSPFSAAEVPRVLVERSLSPPLLQSPFSDDMASVSVDRPLSPPPLRSPMSDASDRTYEV